jgi:hypothetical protein
VYLFFLKKIVPDRQRSFSEKRALKSHFLVIVVLFVCKGDFWRINTALAIERQQEYNITWKVVGVCHEACQIPPIFRQNM